MKAWKRQLWVMHFADDWGGRAGVVRGWDSRGQAGAGRGGGLGEWCGGERWKGFGKGSVSYTHLTLPTICSV
eukprot:1195600-Rhodomonas_salina.1